MNKELINNKYNNSHKFYKNSNHTILTQISNKILSDKEQMLVKEQIRILRLNNRNF